MHDFHRMVSFAHFGLKIDDYLISEVVKLDRNDWFLNVEISIYAQLHNVVTDDNCNTSLEVTRVKVGHDEFTRKLSELNNVHPDGIDKWYDAGIVNIGNIVVDPIPDWDDQDPHGLEIFIRSSMDATPSTVVRAVEKTLSFSAFDDNFVAKNVVHAQLPPMLSHLINTNGFDLYLRRCDSGGIAGIYPNVTMTTKDCDDTESKDDSTSANLGSDGASVQYIHTKSVSGSSKAIFTNNKFTESKTDESIDITWSSAKPPQFFKSDELFDSDDVKTPPPGAQIKISTPKVNPATNYGPFNYVPKASSNTTPTAPFCIICYQSLYFLLIDLCLNVKLMLQRLI